MKTNVLLSIIMAGMFTMSSHAQNQQIPNGGFENWHNEGQGEDPDNWGSLFNQFNQNANMVTKTATAYSGTYALKLVCDTGSVFWIPGDTIYGSVNLGLVNAQISNAKVPFASMPDSLTGYIKSTVINGGFYMQMGLYKAGQNIANAIYITTTSFANYTRFSVPVTYSQTITPDTMTLTMIAAHPGLNPSADPNNEFYMDDLTLVYNPSAIKKAETGFETVLTTKTVSNLLIIENRSGEFLLLTLFDVTGKKWMHGDLKPGNNNFSLQGFPEGMYFYRVTDRAGKTVSSGKWSKR